MKAFYHPSLFKAGGYEVLSPEESRHAIKALRCEKHEKVLLLNGRGQKAIAEITDPDARKCSLRILELEESQPNRQRIHIAIAQLKKRERMEWFIEKAVELGADAITILSTHFTEKKGMDPDRLEKIAISALKQSGNLWLPEIKGLLPFKAFIRETGEKQKFIAHINPDIPYLLLKDACLPGRDTVVLIGPEGDFSGEEVSEALKAGFVPVSLGPLRLRAETAALAALMSVQLINQ
jgi:16S rRNA (uracil1498-N3)-methyltransferase